MFDTISQSKHYKELTILRPRPSSVSKPHDMHKPYQITLRVHIVAVTTQISLRAHIVAVTTQISLRAHIVAVTQAKSERVTRRERQSIY